MPRKINEDRVFEATIALWVEHGYTGTTTLQIAKRAGVNEATLFRRYGDKAGLVVRALTEALRRVPLRDLAPTDDVEHDVRNIVAAYLLTLQQVGAIVPLLFVEASRHAELGPVLEVLWENLSVVVETLAHHQATGALKPGPPLSALASLIGPLFLLGSARRMRPEAAPIDVADQVQAFLCGWGTPGGRSEAVQRST